MADDAGFFSYVQSDDDHDAGNLTAIRKRLSAEVRMQTGEEFVIFQDRDDILWGQRWRSAISSSIGTTTLLIAVLTPSYFRSTACREEVDRFLEREKVLGRDDLILPIYYVEAEAFEDPDDPIAVELRERQYVDWRPYRFEALDSPGVRAAVARLAGQIVAAVRRASPPVDPNSVRAAVAADEDDAPGFLEALAEMEDAFPSLVETMESFAGLITEIGDISRPIGEEMAAADNKPKPAAAKLRIAHQLGQRLKEPAEQMKSIASDYLEQLARVEGGVVSMAERVPELTDAEEIRAAREFHETLVGLAEQAKSGFAALDEMADSVGDVSRLSSTVRPVLRSIATATRTVTASLPHYLSWESTFRERLAELDAP